MTKPLIQRRRRLTSILIRSGLQWLLFAGLLLPAVAMAQAAPILEVEFDPIPAGQYHPGDAIPVSLKFSNTGDADATSASMALTLASDVTVSGRSCSVVTGGPTGSLCGNLGTGSGGGLYTNATIKPGGALKVGATLKFAANAVGDKLITATFSATGVAAASVDHTFVRIPTTDLAVTVTAVATSPVVGNCPGDDATYTPGCAATYTVEVKNNGPDAANGATLSIARTEVGHTAFNWACDAAGTGATCPSASGTGPLSNAPIATFPSGGTLTYTVTVNHGVDDDFPEAKITAAIVLPTTPADMVDTNTNNNSDSAQRNRNAAANLKVTATRTTIASPASNCPDGSGTQPGYTPGCVATYRVEYSNSGPDAADGSSLKLVRSEDPAAQLHWTCVAADGASCPAAAGDAPLSASNIASFPKDGRLIFDITVSHPSSALYPNAGMRAEVWPPANGGAGPIDIDHDDNVAVLEAEIDRRAAIRVEKRALSTANGAPVSNVFVNAQFEYEITVQNEGPSDVGNALDGSGNPELDPTGPALLLNDVFDGRLKGVSDSSNDCPVSPDDEKPCWKACTSTLELEGDIVADRNLCPADALLPGAGDIEDMRFALRAGTGSRVRTLVKVGSELAQNTSITNTAAVSLSSCGAGDASCAGITLVQPSTLSAEATVVAHPAASVMLEVENAGAEYPAVPGKTHSYKIRVSNMGLYNLSSAQVSAEIPLFDPAPGGGPGFISDTVYYQCLATNGASCTTTSGAPTGQAGEPTPPVFTNALSVNTNLPHGGSVVFTLTGELDPRADGNDMRLTAKVVAAPAPDVTASATTQLTPQAELTLTKQLYKRIDVGGLPVLSYKLVAQNTGPSFVAGAHVLDGPDTVVGTDLDFGGAQWSCQAGSGSAPGAAQCSATSGTGAIGAGSLALDLMPGASALITLDNVATTSSAGPKVTNIAKLEHALDRPTAEVTTTLRSDYTLDVEKTDGQTVTYPGTDHTYSIKISNQGPDDAYDVNIEDVMPTVLQNVKWTCSATSPVPGDLSPLQASVDPKPAPGEALTITRDGRHIYVLGKSLDNTPVLYAYNRNATPGLDFGKVDARAIDREENGVDDSSDTGSAVVGMDDPVDLILSADQSVLYVLSKANGAGSIVVFHRVTDRRDPEFGRLSFAGSVSTQLKTPRRIVITATHLYVAGTIAANGGATAAQIEVFKPNVSNQLPMPVAGGVIPAPDGAGPMVVDAATGALFVAAADRIQHYAITPDGPNAGLLTANVPAFPLGGSVERVSDLLLAHNEGEGVDIYALAGHSTNRSTIEHLRSSAAGLGFQDTYGADPALPLDGQVRIALSPDGEHLIGINHDEDAVFTLRRDIVTGGLSGPEQVLDRTGEELAEFVGLNKPTALVVTPDSRHVVITSGSTTAVGPLTVLSRRAPPPQLGFIELDRDGDALVGQAAIDSLTAPADVATRGAYVYVLSKVDSAVTLFERRLNNVGPEDEDGGHLSHVQSWRNGQGGISGMASPDRILISPDGTNLFVSSVNGNSVAVFKRNNANGTLTFVQAFQRSGAPGLDGAFGMAMDPGSKHLYVAGSYASSIAIFGRDDLGVGSFVYLGVVTSGQGGVTGLNGIRDLVVTDKSNGSQVLGVSDAANTVVAFDRDDSNGSLQFVQALVLGSNQRPMSLALSPANRGNTHVYVAAQNSNSVHILQRVRDTTSPMDGRLRRVGSVSVGAGAPQAMSGPRDVSVSPDGKHVYVAAEFGHSLVAFYRYDNASSALFGQLDFIEARTQDVDSVDGLQAPYAVAVADDSRNVYVAGFDSNAVASFSVGTGSFCSASGAGDIHDVVTIRAGGAVTYRVTSKIRSDASGTLSNTAKAIRQTNVDGTVEEVVYEATDETDLVTLAGLELTKTNNQVAVVPGTEVTYDITVTNHGPGNVVGLDDPGNARITDLFGAPFDLDTIRWTCSATGSGALDFLASYKDGVGDISGLHGISSLALIPDRSAAAATGVRGNFLAGASVDDDAVVFFQRDSATGALSYYPQARLDHSTQTPLQGARSVAVSADGSVLFVVSRQSDSLNVFSLTGSDSQDLIVTRLATAVASASPPVKGLDKALHVISVPVSANVDHIYVAGANDHAVAAFSFDRAHNTLDYIGNVSGVPDVEYLVASPDGAQVYALSGSTGSVALFNRDPLDGSLSSGPVFVDAGLAGVSSGVFSADGRYLYLTASTANRLVQLERITDAGAGNFGNLSAKSSIEQGAGDTQGLLNPRRIAISADGHHLYVTALAGSSVAWFSLDPADAGADSGKPTFVGMRSNQTGGTVGLSGATGLVIDPVLNQIYVAGTEDQAITHFQRQSDSWCPPNGVGILDGVPVNIAAHGEVNFRVTARVSSNLSGPLVNVAHVHWRSAACDGLPGAGVVDCENSAQDSDEVSASADLSITKDDGLAEFDGLDGASAVAADQYNVYVAAPDANGIGMFQRRAVDPVVAGDVGLRYLGVKRSGVAGVSGLTGVVDLVASADGGHVYAVSPADGAITVFARDPANGRLSFIESHQNGILGVTGMMGARALTLSPDGAHAYVAGGFSNSVAIFKREKEPTSPEFGQLQFIGAVQSGIDGVNGIDAPLSVLSSPDGKQLYVLAGGDTLVVFARQTNSGSGNFGKLTQIGRYENSVDSILGMDTVRAMTMSADGEHLYVLGAEAGSLVHFARDTGNGSLSFVPDPGSNGPLLVAELTGASQLHMGADGRLYVAAKAQNAVLVFERDVDGTPTLVHTVYQGDDTGTPVVDGLDGASDVAMVNDSPPWLYVSATGEPDSISALSVLRLDGAGPTYVGSVFDGMGGVAPGDQVTYTIVVENHGPSDVAEALIVDTFPPEFEQVGWTCASSGNATCPNDADGNLNLRLPIPKGGRLQFDATGTVRAQASGRLVNTATVTAIGVLDPDMSNNTATDDDTVLSPRMDLSITVDNDGCDHADPGCTEVTEATPGDTIAYRVVAANAGPTYAKTAVVSDLLPAAMYDVAWTCTASPQAGVLEQVQLRQSTYDTSYRAVAIDPLGLHVYAVGQRSDSNGVRDTLVAFTRNPLNGELSLLQAHSAPPVGEEPAVRGIAGAVDVVVSQDGRFVYVAGQAADAIAVFERNPAEGTLVWRSLVKDSEQNVTGIGGITSLVLAPDGKHLYASGAASQAIAGFAINATTGALNQVSVIRQADGLNGLNGVTDLAFNASGEVLFATAGANQSVSALRRDSASGALTYVVGIESAQGVEASLESPSALAIAGDRVFVADAQGDAVNLLRFVDGDDPGFDLDGVIKLDNDDQNGTQQPVALMFVADQARLYVASAGSSQLHLYSLLGEAPKLIASYDTSTSGALANISAFVLSPNGQQIHAVSGSSGRINTMAREPGSRCPLSGQGGLEQQRVDIAPAGSVQFDVVGRIFANATGSLSYAVAVDPRVVAYETDPTNNRAVATDTLVPRADLDVVKTRPTPDDEVIAGLPVSWQIHVDNHGISDALHAQVGDDLPIFPAVTAGLKADSGEWTCAINVPLESRQYLAAAAEPLLADVTALASTADGQRWFGVSNSRGALIQVRLDPAGAITRIETVHDGSDVAELAGATDVALSPDGAYLYVTSTNRDMALTGNDLSEVERRGDAPLAVVTGNLLVFALGDNGVDHVQTLTSGVGPVSGLRGAKRVISSADGRYVYVAAVPSNVNNSAIALFRRDADNGELSFVERVQDGLGTLGNESNVIRDISRLHLTADGRHLYVLSQGSKSQSLPQQQALARFDVDGGSGKLHFAQVMRAVDLGSAAPVVPALLGARDFVATPADTGFYLVADTGIVQFSRALNGSLSQVATWPSATTVPAQALAMDVWGARLYFVDAEAGVHVYTRQWSDGSLLHLYSLPAASTAAPDTLLHTGRLAELLLTQRGEQGGLTRLAERPVSRCMQAAGGNADLPASVDLGRSGWTRFDYTGIVHPSARGTLVNVAYAQLADGVDPDPANNTGQNEALINVQSDLSISKTGPADAVAGEYIEYVIRVDNAGPSDALGIHVRDDLDPARFQGATWSCAIEGEGDSACASATGAGNALDVPADLHVGDTLVVTLRVKVNPAWLGPLQNAAYVVPEPDSVDPTPDDHTATPVETIVVRRADVAVTKTTRVAEVVAGAPVGYTITVHNAGPSDAPDVDVRDSLPSGLRDAHWTCATQLGTGTCAAATGSGSINQRVSIPAGETLIFQLDGTLSPSAAGALTNTAKATVRDDPAGDVLDPDTDNNTATVEDPILQKADLALSAVAPDAYDPNSTVPMPYRIALNNLGPSNAALSIVVVTFDAPVTQSNAGCEPMQGTQFRCSVDSLAAGTMVSFELGLRDLPNVPATLVGNLSVGSQTDDPVRGNNTASTSTQMRAGVDLDITIDDGLEGLAPGDSTRYTVKVRNVGSVDAIDARVLVPLANELLAASWQCTAPTGALCGSGGNGGIDDLINLPAGATLVYTLDAVLDPDIDSLVHDSYEQSAEVVVSADQTEVSTQNNAASDINVIYKVIFKDGFEEPVLPRPGPAAVSAVWPGPMPVAVVPMPDAALPSPPARASVHRIYTRAGDLT